MIEKLRRRLDRKNDHGSSFVLVIVATTFMCILAAALLMGAFMTYKLKFYKLNSLNNFYEVEKALDEIYAGIGASANEHLYTAYTTTAELVVTYDSTQQKGGSGSKVGSYETLSNDEANDLFKKLFMSGFTSDSSYSSVTMLKQTLESYISNNKNSSIGDKYGVELSMDNFEYVLTSEKNGLSYTWVRKLRKRDDGSGNITYIDTGRPDPGFDADNVVSVAFRNICIKRTVKLAGGEAGAKAGDYVQSITTDIVLRQPEYNVSFDVNNQSIDRMYNFAVIADMGIEVESGVDKDAADTNVTINGNVYAANDYYNKNYNNDDATKVTHEYDLISDGQKNKQNKEATYGNKINSAYSGIFVSGNKSTLKLRSDIVLCPGTLTAYNGATIDLASRSQGTAQLWTDSILIGGSKSGTITATADAYVFDDTELNAEGSTFTLGKGSRYFGYSYNGNDVRNLDLLKTKGLFPTGFKTRAHFGDSAIIVNGKKSKLDIKNVDSLYIAGKSYIEFSKVAASDVAQDDTSVTMDENADFAYTTLADYSTGQSLDVKTNQLVFLAQGAVVKDENGNDKVNDDGTYTVRLPITDQRVKKFYKDLDKATSDDLIELRVVKQTISGHDYYYLYIDDTKSDDGTIIETRESKAEKFIEDYYSLLESPSNQNVEDVYNVKKYENFDVTLLVPEEMSKVKTAGALTGQTSTVLEDENKTVEKTLYMRSSNDTELDVRKALANAAQERTFSTLMDENALYTFGGADKKTVIDGTTTNVINNAKTLSNITSVSDSEKRKADKNISTILSYMYINLKDHLSATDKKDSADNDINAWSLSNYTLNSGEYSFTYDKDSDKYSYDYSLTPLNYYINYNYINKKNLDIQKDLKDDDGNVFARIIINANNETVNINSPTKVTNSADGSGVFEGIIITSGNIRFGEKITGFKGLIVSGAKVKFDHSMTVTADAMYVSSVLERCIDKDKSQFIINDAGTPSTTEAGTSEGGTTEASPAQVNIIRKIFNTYKDTSTDETTTVDGLSISDISYEDILEFQNWKKNVQ